MNYKYDKNLWETRVREISAFFKKYPFIDDSGVSFRFSKASAFMVNSEGSEVKSPVDIAIITISATSTTPDGMRLSDNIEVIAPSPADIPSDEWFEKEIALLANRLKNIKTAETFAGTTAVRYYF
ncbi:MAG: hypothetical protein HC905_04000 [Bacteroidales bacterium]|nr:hypothetical protein [Bacteroidales bacterium]